MGTCENCVSYATPKHPYEQNPSFTNSVLELLRKTLHETHDEHALLVAKIQFRTQA